MATTGSPPQHLTLTVGSEEGQQPMEKIIYNDLMFI